MFCFIIPHFFYTLPLETRKKQKNDVKRQIAPKYYISGVKSDLPDIKPGSNSPQLHIVFTHHVTSRFGLIIWDFSKGDKR